MSSEKQYYLKLAVVVRMPMAFERFCDKTFTLKKIQLQTQKPLSEADKEINVMFEIYHPAKVKVATFKPLSDFTCLDKVFEPIFQQIVDELNYAISKADYAQDDRENQTDKKWMKDLGKKN